MSARGRSRCALRALVCGALLCFSASSVVSAEPVAVATGEPRARHGFHWSATLGWFGALSGPLRHGPAAHLETLPGGIFGRFGFGVYYRGDELSGRGLVLAGAVYEAASARPGLVMTLHAAAGYDTAHAVPVLGTGWRIQLGVAGPFVASSNLTGQFFLDGVATRLGIALGVTLGFAR